MKDKIQRTKEYLDYIEEHYNNVQRAWKIIQEKCDGMGFDFLYDDFKFHNLDIDIKYHDFSKLSQQEFVPYRKQFFPTSREEEYKIENKKDFGNAWEYHKLNNNHHWENWTKIEGHNETGFLTNCVVHNVCDWMAMGMKFNDTAQSYYEKNKEKIIIPEWAEALMYEIFSHVYPNSRE